MALAASGRPADEALTVGCGTVLAHPGLVGYGDEYIDFAAFIAQEAHSTGITLKVSTPTFPDELGLDGP